MVIAAPRWANCPASKRPSTSSRNQCMHRGRPDRVSRRIHRSAGLETTGGSATLVRSVGGGLATLCIPDRRLLLYARGASWPRWEPRVPA
jgi:hypothetical protein